MPFVEWNESLDLGIETIDGHHRHLISLINAAYTQMSSGNRPADMARLLNELVDYATYHFAAEEFWMKQYDYPRLDEHAREHDEFCIKVVEQELLFESGDSTVLPELVAFLSTWLIFHIQNSDGAYGEFARSIGATHVHDQVSSPPCNLASHCYAS